MLTVCALHRRVFLNGLANKGDLYNLLKYFEQRKREPCPTRR